MSKAYISIACGSKTHIKLLAVNDEELTFLAHWENSPLLLIALRNPTPDLVWEFVRRLLSAPDVQMNFPLHDEYHFTIDM